MVFPSEEIICQCNVCIFPTPLLFQVTTYVHILLTVDTECAMPGYLLMVAMGRRHGGKTYICIEETRNTYNHQSNELCLYQALLNRNNGNAFQQISGNRYVPRASLLILLMPIYQTIRPNSPCDAFVLK